MECPICRTRMEDDMFSPLTQNITDLLAVPCIFMDQGCTIKLKKKEIVEHEKEKCKYRELMCPGCKEKIQARKLPDHFLYCAQLVRREHHQHVHLDETKNIVYPSSKVTSRKPFVFKLDNSYNWFLLCIDRLEDKLVYHVKHYSGEERMETFNYNLKISNTGNTFSVYEWSVYSFWYGNQGCQEERIYTWYKRGSFGKYVVFPHRFLFFQSSLLLVPSLKTQYLLSKDWEKLTNNLLLKFKVFILRSHIMFRISYHDNHKFLIKRQVNCIRLIY